MAPIVFSASGANAAAIQSTIDSFRSALGALNPNSPATFPDVGREINGRGSRRVSAPNLFPGEFFNGTTPGALSGSHSQALTSNSGPASAGRGFEFGNFNATVPALVTTFGSPKLFSGVNGAVTDVNFILPEFSTRPATTSGFGVVFAEVDMNNVTKLEFFAGSQLVDTLFAPCGKRRRSAVVHRRL